MRRAMDQVWLEEPNSPFYGICLGADFTAEHEHGIDKLKQDLGIPKNDLAVYGIAKRQMTCVPENRTLFYKEGDTSMFLYGRYVQDFPKTIAEVKKRLCNELLISNQKLKLGTAWDEGSFGIIVEGQRNQTCLEELHSAFLQKRVALWFGGGQTFGNPGLCVGIVDAIPQEHLDALYESDKKYHGLIMESERIGIVQRIDELNRLYQEGKKWSIMDAPFGYYALSPKWFEGGTHNKRKSQYKVMYWLNPMNQNRVNYGYFTVEELEQWLQGKGPIPMTEKQLKEKAGK